MYAGDSAIADYERDGADVMEITYKNKNDVRYCDLCAGDVFIYLDKLYMKTNQRYSPDPLGDYMENLVACRLLAVELETGYAEIIDYGTKVRRVECELIVR